jgi:hypothetical protein
MDAMREQLSAIRSMVKRSRIRRRRTPKPKHRLVREFGSRDRYSGHDWSLGW